MEGDWSPQAPVWGANWTHRVRFPPLCIDAGTQSPKSEPGKLTIPLLLCCNQDGVSKSPEKRSSLPRPSSILPPRRGVSGERDREENSLSLTTSLSSSVRRTTRMLSLFWHSNLLLLLWLSPSSLDLSHGTASCVPTFETEWVWKSEPTHWVCSCAWKQGQDDSAVPRARTAAQTNCWY